MTIMNPDHPAFALDPRDFSDPPVYICDCPCPCGVHVEGPGVVCPLCADGECAVIVTELVRVGWCAVLAAEVCVLVVLLAPGL